MRYEDFLQQYVGDFGVFQILIVVFIGMANFPSKEPVIDDFIAGYQDHWCYVPELQDVPHDQQKLIAIPQDDDGNYESCYAFNISFSSYTTTDFYYWNRSLHVTNDMIPCTDWVYDKSQYVATITSELDLVCEDSWKVSFISSSLMIGYLLASVFSGILSDRFGRIKTAAMFVLLKVLASIVNIYASSYIVFVIGRCLVGMGAFGYWLVLYVYAAELSGSTYRATMGNTIYLINSVGSLYAVITALFIRDYIGLLYLNIIPIIFVLFAFLFLPESPRFLLVKSKLSEAEDSLRKIATINKRTIPKNFDFRSLEVTGQPSGDQLKNNKPWRKVLTSKLLILRLVIISFIWFTCALMSYGLYFNIGTLSGNIYLNSFFLSAVDIPALFIAFYGMRWRVLGRRFTCGLSLLVAAICSFITIPLIAIGAGTWSTALSIIGKCFITTCFSSIYLYSCELLPTEVRSGGIGFASTCARISGMIAPFIGGPLIKIWAPLPSLIFGSTTLVAGILCIWCLPETLGKKMVDTVDEAIAASATEKLQAVNQTTDSKLTVESKFVETDTIKFNDLSVFNEKTNDHGAATDIVPTSYGNELKSPNKLDLFNIQDERM